MDIGKNPHGEIGRLFIILGPFVKLNFQANVFALGLQA
jgi:hypothetical protein